MQRWHFGTRRYVPYELLRRMRAECGALVLSNVQPHSAVPFIVGARRLGLPIVAHVASWDHTVGKGVIAPFCDTYIVQNEAMREDLARYHDIGSERVVVTGWPQTDLYATTAILARSTTSLVRSFGLDPRSSARDGHGEHAREHAVRGVGSSSDSWRGGRPRGRAGRPLLFRPHPRDREWSERFRAALATHGSRGTGGELHRLRGARDPAPALRLRRRERGDDPARRARERPARRCASSTTRARRRARAAPEERHRGALPRARDVGGVLPSRVVRRGRRRDRTRARASGRARRRATARRPVASSARSTAAQASGSSTRSSRGLRALRHARVREPRSARGRAGRTRAPRAARSGGRRRARARSGARPRTREREGDERRPAARAAHDDRDQAERGSTSTARGNQRESWLSRSASCAFPAAVRECVEELVRLALDALEARTIGRRGRTRSATRSATSRPGGCCCPAARSTRPDRRGSAHPRSARAAAFRG